MVLPIGVFFCSILFVILSYAIIKLINRFTKTNMRAIAFFHPYANAGGGGERVLWQAVRCVQINYPDYDYYIYTGDLIDEQQLVANVERSFEIKLIKPIKCIQIKTRFLVEAKYYRAFTLLGQSLASIVLAIECIMKLNPIIVIDTMGYAFTYWLFRLFGCRVASYTHYPTISTDMLESVTKSEDAFNNRSLIARSRLLTQIKLYYYRLFARLYGLAGRYAEVVMVNSSWTLGHINQLWDIEDRTHLVYPPCNTNAYLKLEINSPTLNKYQILSLAQFRPEKNHKLQIQIVDRLLSKLTTDDERSKLKLVLVGSVRNEADQKRVDELKTLVNNLGIDRNIEFKLNIPFSELLKLMNQSSIGLHTMKNEHFGIAVVESMAAGLIMVAHNSAGPRMDIIDHGSNGYLATTLDEYVDVISSILTRDESIEIRQNGRNRSYQFSDCHFETLFLNCIKNLID